MKPTLLINAVLRRNINIVLFSFFSVLFKVSRPTATSGKTLKGQMDLNLAEDIFGHTICLVEWKKSCWMWQKYAQLLWHQVLTPGPCCRSEAETAGGSNWDFVNKVLLAFNIRWPWKRSPLPLLPRYYPSIFLLSVACNHVALLDHLTSLALTWQNLNMNAQFLVKN